MKYLLLFIAGYFFISACKKNVSEIDLPIDPTDTMNSNVALLRENTFIVDTSHVLAVEQDFVRLHEFAPHISVGAIIMASPSENAPFGFLRRIIAVSQTSGGYLLQTEEVGLHEAFKRLHIDTIFTEVEHIEDDSLVGVNFMPNRSLNSLNGVLGGSLGFGFNQEIYPGLKGVGRINITVSDVRCKYDLNLGEDEPSYVEIYSTLNTEGTSIGFETLSPMIFGEKKLKEKQMKRLLVRVPIPLPVIGVTIVRIPFAQRLRLYCGPFNIGAKLKLGITPTASMKIGIKYENGNWKSLSTSPTINWSPSPINQNNFDIKLNTISEFTILRPAYELAPFNGEKTKLYTSLPIKASFEQKVNSKPNYILRASLSWDIGGQVGFWGRPKELKYEAKLEAVKILDGIWNTDRRDTLKYYLDTLIPGVWRYEYKFTGDTDWNYDDMHFNNDGVWHEDLQAYLGSGYVVEDGELLMWRLKADANGRYMFSTVDDYTGKSYPEEEWFPRTIAQFEDSTDRTDIFLEVNKVEYESNFYGSSGKTTKR